MADLWGRDAIWKWPCYFVDQSSGWDAASTNVIALRSVCMRGWGGVGGWGEEWRSLGYILILNQCGLGVTVRNVDLKNVRMWRGHHVYMATGVYVRVIKNTTSKTYKFLVFLYCRFAGLYQFCLHHVRVRTVRPTLLHPRQQASQEVHAYWGNKLRNSGVKKSTEENKPYACSYLRSTQQFSIRARESAPSQSPSLYFFPSEVERANRRTATTICTAFIVRWAHHTQWKWVYNTLEPV